MNDFKCDSPKNGGIKAMILSPWIQGPDERILKVLDPFFQIGDALAEKGETIDFGDISYTKLSD